MALSPIRYGNWRLDSGFTGIQPAKMTLQQFIAKRGLARGRLSALKPVLISGRTGRRTPVMNSGVSALSIWPATATGSGNETQFIVNGVRITYDLRPIAGDCEIFDRASVILGKDEHIIPFTCRRNKIFLADIPRVKFSGYIGPIRNRTVTLDTMRFEPRPDGRGKQIFSPLYKVSESEFKMIKGERWLVSTQFKLEIRGVRQTEHIG